MGDLDQGLSYSIDTSDRPSVSKSESFALAETSASGMRGTDRRVHFSPELEALQLKFSRLGHENPKRYQGVFIQAKEVWRLMYTDEFCVLKVCIYCVDFQIYKLTGLSAEGHRNYPLREAKALRRYSELQLSFAPWLEQWGRCVANKCEIISVRHSINRYPSFHS